MPSSYPSLIKVGSNKIGGCVAMEQKTGINVTGNKKDSDLNELMVYRGQPRYV